MASENATPVASVPGVNTRSVAWPVTDEYFVHVPVAERSGETIGFNWRSIQNKIANSYVIEVVI